MQYGELVVYPFNAFVASLPPPTSTTPACPLPAPSYLRPSPKRAWTIRKVPLGLNHLSSPSQPLVDVIFVHGLGGGSRKTWSKTGSVADFWAAGLAFPTMLHSVLYECTASEYDSDWV